MPVRRSVLVGVASVILGFGALAGRASAEESLWQTDFEAAKAKAKAEKKLLLVDFTGSDWCGWCKRLVSEVFGKEEFKKEAPVKFVLVELDYPSSKKQSDELKKQNKELQKRYKVQGFPTIFVMDADGKVVAQTGYRPGGPNAYMKHLGELVDAYESVVKMRKELPTAKGIDRAKLLDKLVDAYVKLNNETDELAAWDKEIVVLDADGKAGLKSKHEFRALTADIEKLKEGGKIDEMKALAEKAAALPGVTADQKRGLYLDIGQSCFRVGDFVSIVACLKKAIEADPKNDEATQLQTVVKRFEPMADAQQTVAKLKTQLEGTKDLDRAKLLDKMVEADDKLASLAQLSVHPQILAKMKWPQEMRQWSQEIITLDADGKGGLKQKHEFRLMLSDAEKLFQEKKPAEAHAAIEKALATARITADQTQGAHYVNAVFYLKAGDLKQGLASMKKALKAAPESDRAKSIKALIGRIESQLDGGDK
jgi:thioredoxin-related protein